MKVISISTFVALAALVHSSSALWCDCYTKQWGIFGRMFLYDEEFSEGCCNTVMNSDLMTGWTSKGYCDAGDKGDDYKDCCGDGETSYGYCK